MRCCTDTRRLRGEKGCISEGTEIREGGASKKGEIGKG
jgi:hypothetical protein